MFEVIVDTVNRFLNGASMGAASTATGTIVAKIIPNERRGEGTGYYALSTTIASAFGPFLGMFITEHGSFYINFVVCIALLAVNFMVIFFVNVPKLEFNKKALKNSKGFSIHNFFEVKSLPIASIYALIAFGYSSILVFLTSYIKEINLVNSGSIFFIVYAVSIFITRPFTGRLFDKKGENFVMYPAILAFSIAFFILSHTHNGMVLMLVAALAGFGYGTFSSSVQAIAIKVSPKHRMSLATSTSFIFGDLGAGIGPFILGYFIPLTGYRGLYMMMSVLVFVCIFLYYLLHGRKAVYESEVSEGCSF